MQVKYFNKESLVSANNRAITEGRNRTLRLDVLYKLDEDNKYPVTMAMDHNNKEIRVAVLLSCEDKGFLDISYEEYENLPTIEIPADHIATS
jgi:hypothetical protein